MVSPFVIGAGIAFVFNVPMRGIENRLKRINKKGLRRGIALLLTFAVIFLVLFLVVQLLIPQVVGTVEKLGEQLPVFYENVEGRFNAFLDEHPQIMKWLSQNTDLEQMDWTSLLEKFVGFVGDSASDLLVGTFSAITSLSTGIFKGVIAFVFSLYCLFRKEILARQARHLLYAFLPERFCDRTVRVLRLTGATFSNFLSGQCLEACVLGCMFAICMLIFRMPYVPLISVLVAICALVPIVGAFVGCILGAFFILVNDPMQAIWFVIAAFPAIAVSMFISMQNSSTNKKDDLAKTIKTYKTLDFKKSSKANQLQRSETPKFFRKGKWLYELFLHYFHTQIIVSYR